MTTYVMRSTRDGVVAEASIEIASDQRFADFTIVVDRRRPGGRWQRVAELEGTDATLLAAAVIARGMLASALVCTIIGTDVPASSVRSYLNINTPGRFTRTARGRYKLSGRR